MFSGDNSSRMLNSNERRPHSGPGGDEEDDFHDDDFHQEDDFQEDDFHDQESDSENSEDHSERYGFNLPENRLRIYNAIVPSDGYYESASDIVTALPGSEDALIDSYFGRRIFLNLVQVEAEIRNIVYVVHNPVLDFLMQFSQNQVLSDQHDNLMNIASVLLADAEISSMNASTMEPMLYQNFAEIQAEIRDIVDNPPVNYSLDMLTRNDNRVYQRSNLIHIASVLLAYGEISSMINVGNVQPIVFEDIAEIRAELHNLVLPRFNSEYCTFMELIRIENLFYQRRYLLHFAGVLLAEVDILSINASTVEPIINENLAQIQAELDAIVANQSTDYDTLMESSRLQNEYDVLQYIASVLLAEEENGSINANIMEHLGHQNIAEIADNPINAKEDAEEELAEILNAWEEVEEELEKIPQGIPNDAWEEIEEELRDIPNVAWEEIKATLAQISSEDIEPALAEIPHNIPNDARERVEVELDNGISSCCGLCPFLRGLGDQFRNIGRNISRLFRRKSARYELNKSQPELQPVTLIGVRSLEEEEG